MTTGDLALITSVARIVTGRVDFTESSLVVTDPDLSYDEFETLLSAFGRGKRSFSFFIGDLLNFGETAYGDRYAQAMELTGLRYETLTNYAWVCRRVPRSRRRDHLSFGFHSEIASLTPTEQKHWLAEAARNGWTKTSQIRDALRAARAPEPTVEAVSEPLSANRVAETAGALRVVRDALVAADATPALRALDSVGETLRVAVQAPTLRDVAVRVVQEAVPNGSGTSAVPTPTIHELADLVREEQ